MNRTILSSNQSQAIDLSVAAYCGPEIAQAQDGRDRPVRLGPKEDRARYRAKIVEALDACGGGPLNASTLRTAAFGGGMVDAVLYADVLRDLEDDGVIRSRWVQHWVGRGGGGCRIYWKEIVVQRKPTTTARLEDAMPLYLDPDDRQALIDFAHQQLEAARADAATSVAEEQRWLRISSTLLFGEDQEEPVHATDTDTDTEATS